MPGYNLAGALSGSGTLGKVLSSIGSGIAGGMPGQTPGGSAARSFELSRAEAAADRERQKKADIRQRERVHAADLGFELRQRNLDADEKRLSRKRQTQFEQFMKRNGLINDAPGLLKLLQGGSNLLRQPTGPVPSPPTKAADDVVDQVQGSRAKPEGQPKQ